MLFGIGKMCLEKNMIRISTCIIIMHALYFSSSAAVGNARNVVIGCQGSQSKFKREGTHPKTYFECKFDFRALKILSSLRAEYFLHKTQFGRVQNTLLRAQNMIFRAQNCGRDLIPYYTGWPRCCACRSFARAGETRNCFFSPEFNSCCGIDV